MRGGYEKQKLPLDATVRAHTHTHTLRKERKTRYSYLCRLPWAAAAAASTLVLHCTRPVNSTTHMSFKGPRACYHLFTPVSMETSCLTSREGNKRGREGETKSEREGGRGQRAREEKIN